MTKRILAGNWKMNLLSGDARALYERVAEGCRSRPDLQCVVFPPATSIAILAAARAEGDPALGAQNCHFELKGAFTGEISAEQARDAGARYALVGHSERRRLFCESDLVAKQKLLAVWRAGLNPVLCVGETLAERERRETRGVLARQKRAPDRLVANPENKLAICYSHGYVASMLKATDGRHHAAYQSRRDAVPDRPRP